MTLYNADRDWIVRQLPRHLRPFAPRALKYFETSNPNYHVDSLADPFLREQIRIIANDLYLNEHGKRPKEGILPPEYCADNLTRSETARERIRPEIERIRSAIFGKTRPSFRTVKAASDALIKEIKADEANYLTSIGNQIEWREKVESLKDNIFSLMKELNSIHPVKMSPASDRGELELFVLVKRKKSNAVLVPCPFGTFPGTRLRKLYEEVKLLARITTFTERAVLFFILADIKPLLVPIKFIVQGPFNTRDLLALYKSLHGDSRKTRKLTAKNAEVLSFVRGLNGPPENAVMEFWKESTEKWNKVYPDREFNSRDGFKKAFERATKKLA